MSASDTLTPGQQAARNGQMLAAAYLHHLAHGGESALRDLGTLASELFAKLGDAFDLNDVDAAIVADARINGFFLELSHALRHFTSKKVAQLDQYQDRAALAELGIKQKEAAPC